MTVYLPVLHSHCTRARLNELAIYSRPLSVATLHEQVTPTIRMKNPNISLHNLKQKPQSAIIFSYNIWP